MISKCIWRLNFVAVNPFLFVFSFEPYHNPIKNTNRYANVTKRFNSIIERRKKKILDRFFCVNKIFRSFSTWTSQPLKNILRDALNACDNWMAHNSCIYLWQNLCTHLLSLAVHVKNIMRVKMWYKKFHSHLNHKRNRSKAHKNISSEILFVWKINWAD